MAKYRCLSDEILLNDNFLSLPASARDLYTYINHKTDDYGFCSEVNSIMRTLGAKKKDLDLLCERKYLIKLEDWLYLEKHFNINNRNLRKDRRKTSNYAEYLERIEIKENGAYSLKRNADILQPNDDKVQPIDDNLQPNDAKCPRNIIQYNTIQSNTIEHKEIETADELRQALRG